MVPDEPRQALAACQAEVAGLREALTSRDLIGQAKGILMASEGVSADEAFDILRRASQRMNVKLRDVAAQLVAACIERNCEDVRRLTAMAERGGTTEPDGRAVREPDSSFCQGLAGGCVVPGVVNPGSD